MFVHTLSPPFTRRIHTRTYLAQKRHRRSAHSVLLTSTTHSFTHSLTHPKGTRPSLTNRVSHVNDVAKVTPRPLNQEMKRMFAVAAATLQV